MKTSVHPTPSSEEAAAIVAALAALSATSDSASGDGYRDLKRQRWRLAGLMGSPPPRRMSMDGSIWSYSSWEGMV